MYPFGKGIQRTLPYLLLLIPFSLYVAFYFGPSLMTVIYSFTDKINIAKSAYTFIGLDNYKELFFSSNSGERIQSMYRTLKFTFTVTIIQNVVALIVAVVLNQKLKGDRFFRSVLFLPVVMGVTIVSLTWLMMFDSRGGPVESLYNLFGYSDTFFQSYDHAFNYIIFVQIWQYMGYSMLIFLAGLQSIPKDLYEAGYIDGTSAWQSFKNITFPLIAPAVTINTVLAVIGAMQTFDIIIALTNGQTNTRTLAFDVYRETFGQQLTLGPPSALSVVVFLFTLGFVVLSISLRKREVEL